MNYSLFIFQFGVVRKPRLEEINSLFQVTLLDSKTQTKRYGDWSNTQHSGRFFLGQMMDKITLLINSCKLHIYIKLCLNNAPIGLHVCV